MKSIIKPIDYLLDRITMYRLLFYVLIGLIVAAVGLSALGYLHYSPFAMAFSAGYITIICWITNDIFARVFEAPVNVESVFITAFILSLIVTPLHNAHDILFLTAISGLAIASKFILAIKRKHIFNPAAVAAVLMSFGPHQPASWWVGTTVMLPFVLVGGLLVVRKIQRGKMVMQFLVAALASSIFIDVLTHHAVGPSLKNTLLHSSLFFLAFIMLTEPLTSPSTNTNRRWYSWIVGLLFPPQVHVFSVYSTPELSLLVGNFFSYLVNPKVKLLLKLQQIVPTGNSSLDFVFITNEKFTYRPGQYMEWTLPHYKPDSRGNRRYLTLASSPTENTLRVGVKFYEDGSSFKKALESMDKTTQIAAGQLGGDFVLPKDPSQKLAFIAGGIGITPYRSMIKYLTDTKQKRDILLFYSEKEPGEFAYVNLFNEARMNFGLKTVYSITNKAPKNWEGQTGHISAEMIKRYLPDYSKRLFYISGPHNMVTAIKDVLQSMGVASTNIKIDFFPGYT